MSQSIPLAGQGNMTKPNRWLNEFANNITSQNGEDGIICKILDVLNESNKWCVEFGACDGKYCSNTFNLIKNKGYSAVLIEKDKQKYQDLLKTYKENKSVIPVNTLVGFEQRDGLEAVLKTTNIPIDFDLLSIDIDGNEYHVWEAVRHYKPKVVVIEYNPTIPNQVEFVQARDMLVTQGSSLSSIDKLAKLKGYDIVSTTETNAIFVDSKYFELFGINDNSIAAMRPDEPWVTYIFSGHDGRIFIKGYCRLPWHGISYSEAKMQQLPKWLCKHPSNYGAFRKATMRFYRCFRGKKI